MAIKTKEELLESIKVKLGEDTSDEALTLVEDINDTLSDLSTRVTEAGDWKAKYEQNDTEWRQKYMDRFFAPGENYQPEDEGEYDETETPKTFDDLFKTE